MTSTTPNNNKPTTNKSQEKAKPKTHSQDFIPSFIRKTYDILEEAKFPQLIDWSPEGNAIVIKKPSEFSQKVLPTYFKHNNLTSFVRQLNMYNFHKRRSQNLEHVYSHELFQKGKRHLLKEIKRKTHDHTSEKAQKSPESQETPQPENTTNLVNENQFLKRLYNEAMSRLAILEQQAKELAIQNQSLMAQIHNSRTSNPFKPVVASFEESRDASSDQVSMTMGKVTLNISSSGNNNNTNTRQPAAPMNKLFAAPAAHNPAQNNVMQFTKQFFTQKGQHGNALTEESSGSTEVSPTSPMMQGRMDHEGNAMERHHQLMMMNPMQIPKLRMEADMQALHIPAQFAAHQQVMRMNSNLGISRQEMSVGQLFDAYNSEFQHGEELLCFADQKRDVGKMAMMAGNVLQQQTNAIAAAAAAAGNIQAVFQDKSLLGKRKFDTEATQQTAANFTGIQEPTTKRHELSIFSRKGMISTGIEDKEIHEGGAGATADDIDLMNFGNPFLSWPKAS